MTKPKLIRFFCTYFTQLRSNNNNNIQLLYSALYISEDSKRFIDKQKWFLIYINVTLYLIRPSFLFLSLSLSLPHSLTHSLCLSVSLSFSPSPFISHSRFKSLSLLSNFPHISIFFGSYQCWGMSLSYTCGNDPQGVFYIHLSGGGGATTGPNAWIHNVFFKYCWNWFELTRL